MRVIAVECQGKLDVEKIKSKGVDAVTEVEEEGEWIAVSSLYGDAKIAREEILLDKCLSCKGKKHMAADETIVLHEMPDTKNDRFSAWPR